MLYLLCVILMFLHTCNAGKYFTVKQCEIEKNCTNHPKSILIAIDGTGSRIYFEESNQPKKYASSVGVNNNGKWIWQSHVANFWEDYKGESHYFYGPDASEMIIAGNQVTNTVAKAQDRICHFLNNFNEMELSSLGNEIGIDIIGFSRGGFAAMELSRKLQMDGCMVNGNKIQPVKIRWMGLYDPVQRDIDIGDIGDIGDGYDNEIIADNVMSVSIAERSKYVNSRSYFGYAVKGFEDKKKTDPIFQKRINASHSGIGGQPGKGDCKENYSFHDIFARLCNKYTVDLDEQGAIKTDIWMRNNAINSNVPIPLYDPIDYYGNFAEINE